MKDREPKKNKICRATQYYKNGMTDLFLLAGKMKVHPRTIQKWRGTKLWQQLIPHYSSFKLPCRRKNLVAFEYLKKRYFSMTKVPEHNRLGILFKDPECTVTIITLMIWRKIWLL